MAQLKLFHYLLEYYYKRFYLVYFFKPILRVSFLNEYYTICSEYLQVVSVHPFKHGFSTSVSQLSILDQVHTHKLTYYINVCTHEHHRWPVKTLVRYISDLQPTWHCRLWSKTIWILIKFLLIHSWYSLLNARQISRLLPKSKDPVLPND